MRKLSLAVSIAGIFVGFSAWAVSPTIQFSELPALKQEPQHKVASKRVTGLFTRSHYHRFDMDDVFSEQVFDRYLKQLDYRKNVLLQSDIDGFKGYSTQFDDMLKSGDLNQAYAMYELVQKRRYERFVYALSLLDEEMAFDVAGDEYEYDRKEASWPKTEAELNELWRQRVKYDALNLKLAGKEWPEIQEVLGKRYNNALKRITQTKSEDVYQVFMNSFARAIDPHTSYLSPRNAERFQVEMSLSLEGIGAMLRAEDDYTIITELVPGGPADKSEQLGPDDKIVGVGQGDEEIVDVVGWRLDDVVDLIKGPKGSTVKLEIVSGNVGGLDNSRVVSIERDKVKLEDRQAKLEIIESEIPAYKGRRLAVIDIPSFYVNLTRDVKKLILEAKEKNVEGLVIDLRNNGGGSLPEAMALSGLFIEQGPVVQVKNGENRVDVKYDPDNTTFYDGKVSVLVNRYSASASEIFAAALQDYGRALVLGEQTFGKGTVQQHRGLSRIYDYYKKPIGYITYTIQKFYRINGGSTQNKGVTPDILFPTPIIADEFGEVVADNTLPWDSIPKARYKVLGEVSPTSFKPLTDKHLSRIADEQEFVFMNEDIARYKADKDKVSVSLVESVRKAEREDGEKRSLTRANLRRKAQGLKPVKTLDDLPKKAPALDPYLDEAANVTFDYIDLGKIAKR